MTIDTTVSISEIADVNAAKSTNAKNSAPKIPPPTLPNVANTCGKATNISPGPCPNVSGLPPEKVYAAGIIISPDKIAIPVSNTSI